MSQVAVIGAGSWGTALAQQLTLAGHRVTIWARKQEVVDSINTAHRNPRYFSDVSLSFAIKASTDVAEALRGADAAVIVTPSSTLRETARHLKDAGAPADLPIIICSKGVEGESGLLPIGVMEDVLGGGERFAVLSGPNHAEEVIRRQPSATVVASCSPETAVFFRDLFSTDFFRCYTSDDPVGVELCAACKNVIAIAVGASYGLGFGDNTAAMLVTRGLAEMSRLVIACGGEALTCMGLAGAGDMVVTCMSKHSRNRTFGEDYLAKGKSLEDFTEKTHMVVEGAVACKTLATLSERTGVELPIADAVRAIIWGGVKIDDAVDMLSDRPLKREFY